MTFFSRSRGLRGGHSHRSKMRFPQPLKAVTSSPSRLFPAVPADSVELAAECSSVRSGRLGNDSADRAFACFHLDTWSVLALFKPAHLPVRRPLCQLVAAPCPRHRHFSHCHPQRRTLGNWWRRSDLNAQLPACKAGTLPLSYVPMCVWRVIERPFSVLGPPSAAFPRPLSFFVREPHRSHQPGATRPPYTVPV